MRNRGFRRVYFWDLGLRYGHHETRMHAYEAEWSLQEMMCG